MALRRRKEVVPERTDPPCVLVVNDDPNALELLVRVLRSAPQGWSVEQARDQLALMDRLVDSRIDVVVIDITAGGIGGGLKLLDGVRNSNDPELAATPVVLVSASASSAMFSWQAGVDELLVRPFHARDLVAAVAAAMERPAEERPRYRRQQLNLVRSGGRRLSP